MIDDGRRGSSADLSWSLLFTSIVFSHLFAGDYAADGSLGELVLLLMMMITREPSWLLRANRGANCRLLHSLFSSCHFISCCACYFCFCGQSSVSYKGSRTMDGRVLQFIIIMSRSFSVAGSAVFQSSLVVG